MNIDEINGCRNATIKQKAFVRSLARQVGQDSAVLLAGGLSVDECSQLIHELLRERSEGFKP